MIEHVSLNINPEKKYSIRDSLLTGVTNADVATAPYFDEVAMTVFNLLEDRTLVAHNVGLTDLYYVCFNRCTGLELEVHSLIRCNWLKFVIQQRSVIDLMI